jgi:hypothetical protein
VLWVVEIPNHVLTILDVVLSPEFQSRDTGTVQNRTEKAIFKVSALVLGE